MKKTEFVGQEKRRRRMFVKMEKIKIVKMEKIKMQIIILFLTRL